jgi:hypothetical protein
MSRCSYTKLSDPTVSFILTASAALSDIKTALSEITETTMVDPNEIAEMTDAASAELDKRRPNAALLRSVLSGIATGIQTVAAAQPAYQALRTAAASVGITLP